MSGDISRANWVVPVQALARADPEGIVRLVACRDGSVTLHLSCAGTEGTVRLDISRAAQLSTGIWEAAGISQQLTSYLDDDTPARPRLPPLPARSRNPAGSLVSAPPPGPSTLRRSPAGIGRGPAVVNEGAAMDVEHARTIGGRLHRIRNARSKSLQVIAGLAAMSKSTLHRIEHGQRAVTLSEILALANALEIAPSELTRLPVPAPANGHTDSTTEAVRLALDAIDADYPEGLVLPSAALREQVAQIYAQHLACQFAEVATTLPGLIRNLHTTLATGTDHVELLDLAVYLHVHVTRMWLAYVGAPTDLVRRSAFLARRLAQERNETTTLAVAEFGVANVLLGGALELGRAKLESITLPPTTATTAGLVGFVTAGHATAAALERRYDDMAAPMDAAADVAERFGATHEVDSLGFSFGPVNVGLSRMWQALEAHEPDQVARIAAEVDPERNPFPVNRSVYWVHVGRALAQLRGRHDDAVRALRTAENIFPTMVLRDPEVRETIATLLPGTRRDAIGTELRRMAHRAGLPV
ncbi:MAG TPA: helix-turn-helix transcriptional regulator [Pseudonocardiaceae bacterium]|nr:helix-turn-helix transcriptional regulator [Pseudonocardiaceae bacterium]